jgi:hypothetical protein
MNFMYYNNNKQKFIISSVLIFIQELKYTNQEVLVLLADLDVAGNAQFNQNRSQGLQELFQSCVR